MRKLWAAACIVAAICAAVASAGDDFRKAGANDLEWATGGTGAVETTVSSNEKTVTKIDATHMKLRSAAKSVESAITDNVAITGGTISGVTYTLPDNSILPAKLYRVSGTPSATTYYRGDNTWSSPAGSGDMTKAVYDVGDDGQVDNAAVADTAVALSADPADCSAGQYASGISANGTLSCSAPPGTGDMLASVYDADSDNVVDSAIATAIQDNLIVDADVQTGAAINAAKIGGGGVSTAEYDFLGTVTSNVQDQIDGKSSTDHAHAATYHPLENQRLGTTDNVIHKTVTADEFISSALDNTRGATVPNTADPEGADLSAGKIWFNITSNMEKVRNGDNTATLEVWTSGAAHTLNFATTGTLTGGIMILDNVVSPTAAQVYGSWNTITTAGTVTLPAAVEGMSTCIATEGALEITLELDGSDTFVLAGVVMDAGEAIINSTGEAAGDYICVIATSAVKWRVAGKQGTWTQATP